MKDLAAAEQAYGRAVEADPGNLPAVIALCVLLERTGADPEALSRRLEHWAELAGNPQTEGQLLMRAGLLHLERTRDLPSAARCFAAAARANPQDRSARQRLSEVYAATDRSEELVATLRQLLETTLDGQGSAALRCRIGWLLHNRLQDPEGAVAAYRGALAVLPGYLPALQALGTIFRQQQDFERLVAVTVAETEGAAESPAVRASRYLEAAELLLDELGRADEAIEACRRALDISCQACPQPRRSSRACSSARNAGPSSPSCTAARRSAPPTTARGTGCCSRWRGCSPGPWALWDLRDRRVGRRPRPEDRPRRFGWSSPGSTSAKGVTPSLPSCCSPKRTTPRTQARRRRCACARGAAPRPAAR